MRAGLALDFGSATRTAAEQIERYLPVIRAAEDQGFSTVWAGETYAASPRDRPLFHLPSALTILAALAGRTTLRLGTAVVLASAWHPLRLAYDTALVDQISGGRLELGIGLGRTAIAERFGTEGKSQAAHLEECLRTLRAAWRSDGGSTTTWPPPIASGGPPLLVGGGVAASARRAARYGDGYYVGSSSYDIDRIRRLTAAYLAECGQRSQPPGPVHVTRFTIVADTDEHSQQLGARFLGPPLADYTASGSLRDAERLRSHPVDAIFRARAADTTLVGSPRTVVEHLRAYERAGVTAVAFRVCAADTPAEVAVETVRALGEQVLPQLGNDGDAG